MAIPALPSDMSSGNVWTAARVNAVYDHLALHRDDRPSLRVTIEAGNEIGSIATATTTVIEWSNGSGTFNATPTVNVGGWAAGTGGNEEIIVPETGLYYVSVHGQWESNSTGYREISGTDNGSAVGPLKLTTGAVNGTGTFMAGSALHFFTASDLLGMQVYQNSGGSRTGFFTLSATWVNSSTS